MDKYSGYTFVARARSLLGRPYSEVDCIGVVRKALGISCQGTNWLWRSINNSSKYRYLTSRTPYPAPYPGRAGLLVFKARWSTVPSGYDESPDIYHVGVLDGLGQVIHSSPSTGVRSERYDPNQWDAWGEIGKFVDYDEEDESYTQDVEKPVDNSGSQSQTPLKTLDECLETLKKVETALRELNDMFSGD